MIQLYQHLDLRPIGIPQTLRLSQYDSDFEIIFKLENFDGTWILDTDTTAEIQGTKTDGHGYSADATFDATTYEVTIAGDVQMTAAAGRNVYEVVLFHDGDRLGSKNFILDVERAALDAETTASDSKIKNFTEMVEAAEDAAETATAAAEAAEEAAASIIPGLSDDAKEALLACFRHVAWIDEHGQDYYDALEDALYDDFPKITAAFDAGGNTIYTDDTLDSLKQYTTVMYFETAESVGTVIPASNYTLTGQLVAGSSTLRVTYDVCTTTLEINGVIDFYNQYVWEYPGNITGFASNMSPDKGTVAGFTDTLVVIPYTTNKRMLGYTDKGVGKFRNRDTGAFISEDYYPIPIPDGATSMTITALGPNTIAAYIHMWHWDTDHYVFDNVGTSWVPMDGKTIPREVTLNSGASRFFSINIRNIDNSDIPDSGKPSSFVVEFS